MTGELAVGLGLALGSAAALNCGFFAQHGAASALPRLRLRRPLHSLHALFRTPRWLAGFFAGLGGWALYIAALKIAPLSLVQAVSAGGIGLLAVLVWRSSGARPARRELVGVALAIGGLALLALSIAGRQATSGHASWLAVTVWLAVSAVVALGAAGAVPAGAGFGVAAGVLYAAGDVATKAAVAGGVMLLFVAAVLASHGLAFVALQLGFQRGGALATAGVATLCTNALPIVAGTTIFDEGVPPGLLGAARLVSFAAVVAGAAALARPEPRRRAAVPLTMLEPLGRRQ